MGQHRLDPPDSQPENRVRGRIIGLAIAVLVLSAWMALADEILVIGGFPFNVRFGVAVPASTAATGLLLAPPTIYAAALWSRRRSDFFWIGLVLIVVLAGLVSLYVRIPSPQSGGGSPG
jgi:hypothetical protein